jgi:uncharacterized membrane protein YqhA
MADPSREGGSASPEGSVRHGSSQPETAPAEAFGAGEAERPMERRFGRTLSLSRVVVIVPVIVLLLAAISSFVYGTDVFIRSVTRVVEDPELTHHNLGFLLLLTDLFLVGATLMIAAFGFYDLFISNLGPSLHLPAWLRMRDLDDLKGRVISMIILVASVSFADVAVESGGALSTLYLGGAVALVVAALTAFLHFGRNQLARSPKPCG